MNCFVSRLPRPGLAVLALDKRQPREQSCGHYPDFPRFLLWVFLWFFGDFIRDPLPILAGKQALFAFARKWKESDNERPTF